jgi:hypothetical protein
MRADSIPLLVSCLVILLLAQAAQSAPTQPVPWHPCAKIAQACTRAGFVPNGASAFEGSRDHSRASFCLAVICEQPSNQYKISKSKYAVSIIAVTLATESTKASLASLWPANRSIFMGNDQLKI